MTSDGIVFIPAIGKRQIVKMRFFIDNKETPFVNYASRKAIEGTAKERKMS